MAPNRNPRIALMALIFCFALAVRAQDKPVTLKDPVFEPGAEDLLRRAPLLLRMGGAKLLEHDGAQWFVAVGVTSTDEPSPGELRRRLTVGRVNALRAAAEFISLVDVETSTTLTEKATITDANGKKTGDSKKELDDETKTRVRAVMKAPPTLGTWRSEDGKLFFYAVGAKVSK